MQVKQKLAAWRKDPGESGQMMILPRDVKGQDPETDPVSDLFFQDFSVPSLRRPVLKAVLVNVSTPSLP